MERLTNGLCREDVLETLENPLYKSQSETWLRLCEIEDILGDEYDLDRLRELVEADKDERCVIYPFKIGEEVYFILDEKPLYWLYKPIMVGHVHNVLTLPDGEIRVIIMCDCSSDEIINTTLFTVSPQNVMQTREDAEVALKKKNND